MIDNYSKINDFFSYIDKLVTMKINIYIIGGAVLLYNDLKDATKDIDLVVDSKDEFLAFESALKNDNFKPTLPTKEYANLELSQIFIKDDFRIDIFHRLVCKGFILSKSMMKRAKLIQSLENISVYHCSLEDIFTFKTMTEREGDLNDCENISKKSLDWQTILLEIKHQIKESKKDIWVTYIMERLDILEDRNVPIPIIDDIRKLAEDYYISLEK